MRFVTDYKEIAERQHNVSDITEHIIECALKLCETETI